MQNSKYHLFTQHLGTILLGGVLVTSNLQMKLADALRDIVAPVVSAVALQEPPVFPVAETRAPRKTIKVRATAYSSTPDQTDSTPFITANGARVYDGLIAANFLPFGAHVRIPGLGNRTFVVEDRMNARYGYGRVDLWMPSREEAKAFGAQWLEMEIF